MSIPPALAAATITPTAALREILRIAERQLAEPNDGGDTATLILIASIATVTLDPEGDQL